MRSLKGRHWLARDFGGLGLISSWRPASAASILDLSGFNNVPSVIVAATFSAANASFNNRATLAFNGTTQAYHCDSIASNFSGTAKPITVITGCLSGAAGGRDAFSLGRASSGTPFMEQRPRQTGDICYSNRRNDANTLVVCSGGTPGITVHVVATVYDGSTISTYQDLTLVQAAAASTGVMTVDQLGIGCARGNGANAAFYNGTIATMDVFTTGLALLPLQIICRRIGAEIGKLL